MTAIPSTSELVNKLHNVPQSLRLHPFWVVWRAEDVGRPKLSKVPYRPDGEKASPTEPLDWCTFDEAVAAVERGGFHGIGLVLTDFDDLVVIDLDNTQTWTADAKTIINRFLGKCYAELSPSGLGVHLVMKGKLDKGHKTRSRDFYGGNVEIYSTGRFVTVTGDQGQGEAVLDMTDKLQLFMEPLGHSTMIDSATWDDPDLHNAEMLQDADIIMGLFADAAGGRVGAQTFKRLYEDGFDDSEDPSSSLTSALGALSTWTCNIEQAYRIMSSSDHIAAYADRRTGAPKFERWFKSEAPKILKSQVLQRRSRADGVAATSNGDWHPADTWAMVSDTSKAYYVNMETGRAVTESGLDSMYSHIYTGRRGSPFISTVLKASSRTVRVVGQSWMPSPYGSDSFRVIEHMGSSFINTWSGFSVTPRAGDVEPWLKLAKHLCPHDADRELLIKRIAYDVQFPHLKANWHPVIIGVQGAGKDSLFMPLSRIFGSALKNVTNDMVRGQYDDYLAGTKIALVGEVRGLSGSALEKIKQFSATGGSTHVNLNIKSMPVMSHPTLWSFYFLTNNEDAIKADKDERRFFVLHCDRKLPQDQAEAYYSWLNAGGSEALMDYLLNLDLSGFDAMGVAPRTEAFMEMVDAAQSVVEDDLQDMMEQQTHGFEIGLINTKALAEVLRGRGRKVGKVTVGKFLRENGWRKIANIYTAIAKRDGKMVRAPSSLWAPETSSLHNLAGTDLYEAIEFIQGGVGADFL